MRIIRQWDLKDCGVICIAYLVEFYGGYIPYEKIREDTYTTQSGTNAYDMLEALKKYGFDAIGKRLNFEELKTLPLPLIGHFIMPNKLEHFMVINKISKKEVILMDPSQGKRKMHVNNFLEIWNQIVLIAVPNRTILKMPKELKILEYLKNIVLKEKKKIILLFIFSFIISLLTVLNSFYLKILLSIFNYQDINNHFYLLIGFFAFFLLLKNLFNYLKQISKLYLNKNIAIDYLYGFLTHLLKIPFNNMQKYQEGEIIARINEAEEIKDLFADILITLILNGILSFLAAIFLYFLSKELLILLLIGLAIYFLIGFISSKILYQVLLKHLENESFWQEKMLEKIRLFSSMKHLNLTNQCLNDFENSLVINLKTKLKHQIVIEKLYFFKDFGLEILNFILLTYGMYLYLNNKLNILNFLTFQSLYIYLLSPLKDLIDILPKFYYLKGILNKISEYFVIKEEQLSEPSLKIVNKEISFSNVTFAYNSLSYVLENTTFLIGNLEHVFLKGESGSGKSTICRLLIKEVDNYQGSILIGKQNILDYNLATIRENLIYLSQSENLIKGSILDNLLFYQKIDFNLVKEVCNLCYVIDIVNKKPLRFNSYVDENTISGGEKQRILLARTLLKKGEIYLFDECLSEVEESLEENIIKNIRNFLKDKTLIYISHRDQSNLFSKVVNLNNG